MRKTQWVSLWSKRAFGNSEEDAVEIINIVPFSIDDLLKEDKGGVYAKGAD